MKAKILIKRTTFSACALLLLLSVTGCSSIPLVGGDGSTGESESRAVAPDSTFLASDDYRDGEEIVGVFLTTNEYARMVEDFTYHDAEFDWGWMKGQMDEEEVVASAVGIPMYSTVRVLPVENYSSALAPEIASTLESRLELAMERLGLTVTSGPADLELGAAIVDYKADRTYAFVTMIDPFIEVELRLRDAGTGESLLLIRDQEHGTTPATAAGDFAGAVLQILR